MIKRLACACCACLFVALPASAGQYANALGKCLYANTSGADRDTLVQWAFVSLGRSRAARQVAQVPESKTAEINTRTKGLITKLTTTSCKKESTQLLTKEPGGMKDAVSALVSEMVVDQVRSQASSIIGGTGSLPVDKASLKEGRKALKGLLGR